MVQAYSSILSDPAAVVALDAAIHASREGDPRAFALLVDTFDHSLRRYLVRQKQPVEEAGDIAQDTWLHAYRALASFRALGEAPAQRVTYFRRWLFRIADRLVIDRYRRYTLAESFPVTAWQGLTGTASELPDPETVLQERLVREELSAVLATLPERDQVVLRRFYLDDWSYRALAQALGISESLVKSRLHDARARCRAAYEARAGERGRV